MIITEVKKQRNNEERYNIFIEGKFCFSASSEAVVRYSLKEGRNIDEESLATLIEKCEEANAYNYALTLIGIRDYTCDSLGQKLKGKQYSSHTINRVLDKLKAYGFINDEKFAEKFIEYSVNIKKNGKNKIMYELSQRGIKGHDIELDEELQFKNALELAEKKLRTIKDKPKVEEKICRFLIQRGYDYEIIKKVIRVLLKSDV